MTCRRFAPPLCPGLWRAAPSGRGCGHCRGNFTPTFAAVCGQLAHGVSTNHFEPYWVPYLSGRGLRTLAYPHPLPERRGFQTAACGQIPCGLSTLRLAIGGVSITEHISFVVFHPILFEKSEVFFGKCHFSVMLLLVPDILNCVLHHRLTYGKHGVSALPFKMGTCRRNGLYPSAAVPLHILDHF